MGRAKEILVKVIASKIANEFVRTHHYSGKVVPNSNLHFGCFLDDKLHGVMQYGSPFMKTKVLPLVDKGINGSPSCPALLSPNVIIDPLFNKTAEKSLPHDTYCASLIILFDGSFAYIGVGYVSVIIPSPN